MNQQPIAETLALLGELAEMDPWQDHFVGGYEYERVGEECQFCGAERPAPPDRYEQRPSGLYVPEQHKPTCLWARTRVFLEEQ